MQPRTPALPQLPARYYARLLPLLDALGVEGGLLLREAGLPSDQLSGDGSELSLAQVERLCETAIRLSGRADLGLQLGARIEPGSHAALGLALLRCANLDAALRLAARYFAVLNPGFRLHYAPGEQYGEVLIQPRLAFSEASLRLHLEAILVALLLELRFLHGAALPALEAHCGLARPAHWRRYRDWLRGPIRFGREPPSGIRLRLPSACLLQPRRPSADPACIEAIQRCEQALRQQRGRGQLGAWVRMMLREAQHGLPDLSELAGLLAMSPRSLARHLAAEGLGLRQLQNEARLQRARQLLATGTMSVEAIALQLGYRDPANFSRAFRRLHGVAPSRIRNPAPN